MKPTDSAARTAAPACSATHNHISLIERRRRRGTLKRSEEDEEEQHHDGTMGQRNQFSIRPNGLKLG